MLNIVKLCGDIDDLHVRTRTVCDNHDVYMDGPFGLMFGIEGVDLLDLIRTARFAGENELLRRVVFRTHKTYDKSVCNVLCIYLRTSQRVLFSVSGVV